MPPTSAESPKRLPQPRACCTGGPQPILGVPVVAELRWAFRAEFRHNSSLIPTEIQHHSGTNFQPNSHDVPTKLAQHSTPNPHRIPAEFAQHSNQIGTTLQPHPRKIQPNSHKIPTHNSNQIPAKLRHNIPTSVPRPSSLQVVRWEVDALESTRGRTKHALWLHTSTF